jgi:hypothetical protein
MSNNSMSNDSQIEKPKKNQKLPDESINISRRDFLKILGAGAVTSLATILLNETQKASARETLQNLSQEQEPTHLTDLFLKERFSTTEQIEYMSKFINNSLLGIVNQNSTLVLQTAQSNDDLNNIAVTFNSATDQSSYGREDVPQLIGRYMRSPRLSSATFSNVQHQPNNPLLTKLRESSFQLAQNSNEPLELRIQDHSLEELIYTPEFTNGLITPLTQNDTSHSSSLIRVESITSDLEQTQFALLTLPDNIKSHLPSIENYRPIGFAVDTNIYLNQWPIGSNNISYTFLYMDENNTTLFNQLRINNGNTRQMDLIRQNQEAVSVTIEESDFQQLAYHMFSFFSYSTLISSPINPSPHPRFNL